MSNQSSVEDYRLLIWNRQSMIQFACPSCGKAYKVADEFSCRHLKCRACQHRIRVPETNSPAHPTDTSLALVETPTVSSRLKTKTTLPWARWLAECQERFGEAPRKFDPKTTKYISISDSWIYGLLFFLPMCKLLKNSRQRSIFRHGQVVWGHIIQANGALWSSSLKSDWRDGGDDAAGELVFSPAVAGCITPCFTDGV